MYEFKHLEAGGSLREATVLDHLAIQGSLDLQFSWVRDNRGRCDDGS